MSIVFFTYDEFIRLHLKVILVPFLIIIFIVVIIINPGEGFILVITPSKVV